MGNCMDILPVNSEIIVQLTARIIALDVYCLTK